MKKGFNGWAWQARKTLLERLDALADDQSKPFAERMLVRAAATEIESLAAEIKYQRDLNSELSAMLKDVGLLVTEGK